MKLKIYFSRKVTQVKVAELTSYHLPLVMYVFIQCLKLAFFLLPLMYLKMKLEKQ